MHYPLTEPRPQSPETAPDDKCNKALRCAIQVLDDLLTVYAPEFSDVDAVAFARTRITERGMIG